MLRSGPGRGTWMCKPCDGAKRALERLARIQGVSEQVNMLKEEDPEAWKAKARACAFRENSVGGQSGRDVLVSQLRTLRQTSSVVETWGIAWMTEAQFVTHFKTTEGMTDGQAKERYKFALASPTFLKRLEHPNVLVGVKLIPKTEGKLERSISQEVASTTSLGSAVQVTAAISQLVRPSDGQLAFAPEVFGGSGTIANAAQYAPPSVLLASAGAPPPVDTVVPPHVFAPPARRTLAEALSDPAEPLAKRRVGQPRRGRNAGVAGPLLELRKRGESHAKRIFDEFGKGVSQLARSVCRAHSQDGKELATHVEASCHKCERLLDESKSLAGQMKDCTLVSGPGMLARAVGIAQELASHHAILKTAQDELLTARMERREKSSQEALASTQARTNACKVFHGHVPGGLLRFLYDKGGPSDKADKPRRGFGPTRSASCCVAGRHRRRRPRPVGGGQP